jgi:outer membrane protein OmpA-like peptidoglycan-associated protein
VTFDSGLLFDFDSATLRTEAEQNLAEFARSMQDFEDTNILIVGHTDAKGPSDYNQELSERRAESAMEFLMPRNIMPGRMTVIGKGESEPVATNETADGRQQNRRVEVAIYANEEYREEVKDRVQGE